MALVACSASEPTTTAQATTTTTTTAPPTTTAEFQGVAFTDPQGAYQMEIDPGWVANHGVAGAEVEVWVVAEPAEGFAPNVNVLTQADGISDMEEYLELSVESGPLLIDDFSLVRAEVVEGAVGHELGVMEYTGSGAGHDLHFLGVFVLDGDLAIIATFTAPEARYGALFDSVEPYLLTLHPAR